MSPRIKRIRKVLNPPAIKGFKPYGPGIEFTVNEPVTLLYEEYEALRLCDYDMFNHHYASGIMNVSRPTFTRIYAIARQKLAKAFVEGRQIVIDGGKVYFDSDWYRCNKCNSYFNNPEKEMAIENCPLCGSGEIEGYQYEYEQTEQGKKLSPDICICPVCGYEQPRDLGIPCKNEKCPKCHSAMRRKRK